jgi:hypothetical protein
MYYYQFKLEYCVGVKTLIPTLANSGTLAIIG